MFKMQKIAIIAEFIKVGKTGTLKIIKQLARRYVWIRGVLSECSQEILFKKSFGLASFPVPRLFS